MSFARGPYSAGNTLTYAAAMAGSGEFTWAAWIKAASIGGFQALFGLFKGASDNTDRIHLGILNTGVLQFQRKSAAGTNFINSAGAVSANVWTYVAVAWNPPTAMSVWLGADRDSDVATLGWVAGLDQTALGFTHDLVPGNYYNGVFGESAFWPQILTVETHEWLAAGHSLRDQAVIMPQHYWDFCGTGNVIDRIGGADWTENGTVASAAGPDVEPWRGRMVRRMVA